MSLKEASKNISLFSKMLQPIIEAGPELERIGNLEEYEKTIKSNIADLKKQEKQVSDSIAASRVQLEQDKADFLKKIFDDKQQIETDRQAVDAYKAGKEEEARKIIADANSTYQSTILNAQNDAKQIVADAEKSIEDNKTIIKTQNETIAGLDKDIAERNATLAQINETLKGMIK